MQRSGFGDIIRVLAYIIISFLLAAVISPLLFKAGKNFAEVFLNKETTDFLTWLAKKAAKAEFDTYFKRSLIIAALLGLWPLIHALKSSRPIGQQSMWSTMFSKPANSGSNKWIAGPKQLGSGLLISSGVFLIMVLVIHLMGWRSWDQSVTIQEVPSFALKGLQTGILVSLVEEILFRGLLMVIFLRALPPLLAIISLSLLFAAVHFLQPPDDLSVANPYALSAGFEMLSLIGLRFLDPELMIASFSTLFMTGIILAFARYRTRSLWLPIGIHAGWVFALKFYLKLTNRHPDHPEGAGIYLGESLLEGVLPLGALILTGIILAIYLRKPSSEESPPE